MAAAVASFPPRGHTARRVRCRSSPSTGTTRRRPDRTSASTAIGALPGAMPPLMGWTSAADNITLAAWTLFALLFLWQFPHFLAIANMYKEEYRKAGILMLPVIEKEGKITARQIVLFTLLLLPVSVAPYFIGLSGAVYLAGASVLGLWFLWAAIDAARFKTVEKSRKLLPPCAIAAASVSRIDVTSSM